MILVKDGEQIMAALPFIYRKNHGMFYIENAWQVARAGIWIRQLPENITVEKKMHIYKSVCDSVIGNLPKYDLFRIKFESEFWNLSPFFWSGFTASTIYTYTIDKRESEELKSTFSKKRRQRINTALKKYEIKVNEIDIDGYWDFFERSYKCKNEEISYTKEAFSKLIKGLSEHDSAQIRSAHDETGIVAAQIVFLDRDRMYYHFCSQIDNMDAQSMLTFDAIKYAMNTGRKFDFEGSILKGPSEFALSFQPDKEDCYIVQKESNKYKIMNGLKNIYSAMNSPTHRTN